MANSEWRIGMNGARFNDQVISGPAGVAGLNDFGCRMLSNDSLVSKGGNVRGFCSNTPRSRFDTGKHCGGSRARKHPVVYSVPAHRSGVAEGIGDALVTRRARWFGQNGEYQHDSPTMRVVGQDGALAHPLTAAECEGTMILARAIRHSPFAIRAMS